MCLSFVMARAPASVSGSPSLRWLYTGRLSGLRTSRTRTGVSFDTPVRVRLREVIQRREPCRVEPPVPAGVAGRGARRGVRPSQGRRGRTGDPLTEKRHAQDVPTVEEAAAVVLEQQRPGGRNARYGQAWPRAVCVYAFLRIGAVPVSEVTTADVLAVLTPIWHDQPETARRVRQRIGAVMK